MNIELSSIDKMRKHDRWVSADWQHISSMTIDGRWKLWRFLIVACLLNKENIMTRAHLIVSGIRSTMDQKMEWNFGLIAEEFKGYLIKSTDSSGNYFSIQISDGGNMNISYNGNYKFENVTKFCGCHQQHCIQQQLNWTISFVTTSVIVQCNGQRQSVISSANNFKPSNISSRKGEPFINLTVGLHSTSQKFKGCLSYFNAFVNGEQQTIEFKQEDDSMQASCSCSKALCNNGTCFAFNSCNCSMVPLEGRYCNDSLAHYDNTSFYELLNDNDKETFSFKLSWSVADAKSRCLVQLNEKNGQCVVYLQNGTVQARTITGRNHTSPSETLFNNAVSMMSYSLTISFEGGHLSIKNAHSSAPFVRHMDSITSIMVGFTAGLGSLVDCQEFSGKMSIYHKGDRLVKRSRHYSNLPRSTMYLSPDQINLQLSSKWVLSWVPAVIICSCVSLVVTISIATFFYFSRKTLNEEVTRVVESRLNNYGMLPTSAEASEYAKVSDTGIYDECV